MRASPGFRFVGAVVAVGLASFMVACDDDESGPTTTVGTTERPSGNPSGSLEPGTNQSTPQNEIPGGSTSDSGG